MHEKFLLAALEQAIEGRGFCSPNPSVGAIAVSNDQIIAKAKHKGAGTPHAEQIIIKELSGKDLSNVTLYVTLEPCNHQGKTPPCVEEIIKSGIKKVVYSYRDPNPIVSVNNTPMILRDNGIDVLHYTLPKIDEFYQSYRYWLKNKLPWITAKIAQTLDGKIAGPNGRHLTLSNDMCSRFTHEMRRLSDVILTTARTVNADDPLFNVRLNGSIQKKTLVIIDRNLSLNASAKIFSSTQYCHIYYDEKHSKPIAKEGCSYYPMPAKDDGLDLRKVIEHLGQLGFHDVWVEAGGHLFTALHKEQLVHRTYVYLVPIVLGSNATSAYQDANIFAGASKVSWIPMEDNMIASLDWQKFLLEEECSLV